MQAHSPCFAACWLLRIGKVECRPHLDEHSVLDQSIFTEDGTEPLDFGSITAVERTDGSQGRQIQKLARKRVWVLSIDEVVVQLLQPVFTMPQLWHSIFNYIAS